MRCTQLHQIVARPLLKKDPSTRYLTPAFRQLDSVQLAADFFMLPFSSISLHYDDRHHLCTSNKTVRPYPSPENAEITPLFH